jgi:hypothetical protein
MFGCGPGALLYLTYPRYACWWAVYATSVGVGRTVASHSTSFSGHRTAPACSQPSAVQAPPPPLGSFRLSLVWAQPDTVSFGLFFVQPRLMLPPLRNRFFVERSLSTVIKSDGDTLRRDSLSVVMSHGAGLRSAVFMQPHVCACVRA